MRRDAGFTLLEVLVAFTMLALVLGAAYASVGAGGRATGAAADRLVALSLAESALDRPGGDLPFTEARHGWEESGFAVTLDVSRHRPGEAALWADLGVAPWRVTATVIPKRVTATVIPKRVTATVGRGGAAVSITTLRLGPVP